MPRIQAVLSVITMCALLIGSAMSASAKPATIGELALQATAAMAGQTIGTLSAMAATLPSLTHSFVSCQNVTEPSSAPSADEAFHQLQRCMVQNIVPIMYLGVGMGMGSGLGTLAGIVGTARLQGHQGNVMGAIGGVFATQLLSFFVISQQVSDFTALFDEEDPGAVFDNQKFIGLQLTSAVLFILPAVAGVLAFNFL